MTKKEIVARKCAEEFLGTEFSLSSAAYVAEINDLTGHPEEILFWSLLGY